MFHDLNVLKKDPPKIPRFYAHPQIDLPNCPKTKPFMKNHQKISTAVHIYVVFTRIHLGFKIIKHGSGIQRLY